MAFVFCDDCKNHYDDSFESEECDGPGLPGHIGDGPNRVEQAVATIRRARREPHRAADALPPHDPVLERSQAN